MKRSIVYFIIAFISMNSIFAQKNDSETATKELEEVFAKMWKNTTFTNADAYFKTEVADDYFTINADGISQTKEELFADKDRLKMLEMASGNTQVGKEPIQKIRQHRSFRCWRIDEAY